MAESARAFRIVFGDECDDGFQIAYGLRGENYFETHASTSLRASCAGIPSRRRACSRAVCRPASSSISRAISTSDISSGSLLTNSMTVSRLLMLKLSTATKKTQVELPAKLGSCHPPPHLAPFSFRMTASEKKSFFAHGASLNRRRVKNQMPVMAALLVSWAVMGADQVGVSAQETQGPKNTQHAASLDQLLDNLTESDLNKDGLDQSNLAIDRMVQKAHKLISKANKERAQQLHGKDARTPLSQVLGQASDTLTDANSYLLKLKELQNALIVAQTAADKPKVDAHETCKDLNLKYKAVGTDLQNLKLGLKTLPWQQRTVADVIAWRVESKLNAAILRIRLRTLQIGAALALRSELDLEAR
jgi:hypothetical protein